LNRSVILAILIAVSAFGWIISGQFSDPPVNEATAVPADVNSEDAANSEIAEALQPEHHGPQQVKVRTYTAIPRDQHIVVRGKTEALRIVDIKAEIPGRVVAIEAEKGQRVKKGDVLVRFAIKDMNAKLKEAEALVRQREIEYNASKSLSKKGFSAKTTLAGSKALLDSARAKAESVRINLDDLIIRAPFDAVVEERPAEIGAYIKDGSTVITLLDEDPFLVTGQVAEVYVNKIKVGDQGSAKLITGKTVTGTVRYVSKNSDPATRTFRVELLVPNIDQSLRGGVTAEIIFKSDQVMAHKISPAILTLNDKGDLGVRSVNDQDIVEFYPVQILSDSNEGAVITGLPDQVRLIEVGQEFVREGEKVLPQTDTAGVQ